VLSKKHAGKLPASLLHQSMYRMIVDVKAGRQAASHAIVGAMWLRSLSG
jgi:hypothetical protein